jgi:D-arabinose 1-dehydrogenase-like Zn-dependent alcohol dehydrogenase
MKAFIMKTTKAPFTAQEVPDPQPGPGQVRIRLHASGVCGTDVHVWNGELPVPFQAGCGRCTYCQKRQSKFCTEAKTWITNGGAYAEYMIAEAEGCKLLPDSLAWEHAAPLFCGGFSAMSAYRAARPAGGDRVAVLGLGGLGHLAVQVAAAMGHEVLVITNSAEKEKAARGFGAHEVLVVKNHAGQELIARGGVDIILSFSPSMKQNSEAFRGLRPGGRFITTAVSAEPIEVDPISMLFNQTSVIGSAHNDPADLVDILKLAAEGKVKPALETYAFDQLNDVMVRLADGKVRFRAVVVQDA